tara:strand:+ start:297 stop:914 length:618 start_codon:yes stop_codon:yes gene_type:complete
MVLYQVGFINPKALDFYDLIMDNLDIIFDEFMHDTLKLSMLKNRLGYQVTWLTAVAETDELSTPIENWIKEGGFHQDQIGYDSRDGEWQTFPLWKANEPDLSEAINQFLPKTIQILKLIPGLHFAAFFKQSPQSAVKPHKHKLKHHIVHFLLNDLDNGRAWIDVNGQKKFLRRKGDCIGFDYTYMHSSRNESASDRINLVLDIIP